MNFSLVNILDFINAVGKDLVQSILENFSCPKIEDFLKTKALP